MVEPPLILAKTVSKWHMSLILWDDINHMAAIHVLNSAFISPIFHPYIIKSRQYLSHLNLGNTGKSGPLPLISKQSTFWTVNFFIFDADPPFGLFNLLIFFLGFSSKGMFWFKWILFTNMPKTEEWQETVPESSIWNPKASSWY